MPIRQKTPQSQVNQYLENQLKQRERVFINVLERIGQECIIEARNNGNYTDQTGNLRSSIGYAIFNNGKIISSSSFESIKNGKEGQKQGRDLVKSLVSEFNQNIVLVVVAGMNYAAYVETKRNVISSSELLAKQQAKIILEKLGFVKK